eukprot:SAG31_NODE_83_length_27039_cov_14.035746_16_plen_144_part_00
MSERSNILEEPINGKKTIFYAGRTKLPHSLQKYSASGRHAFLNTEHDRANDVMSLMPSRTSISDSTPFGSDENRATPGGGNPAGGAVGSGVILLAVVVPLFERVFTIRRSYFLEPRLGALRSYFHHGPPPDGGTALCTSGCGV